MTHVRSGPGPTRWRERAMRSARSWLAPRNVLVRGNGRFHHRVVRPWQMLAVLGLCALSVAWTGWSTYGFYQTRRAVAERDLQIGEIKETNRRIEAELAEYSSSVQFMSAKLDANRASKDELASQNAGLQVRVAQLEDQLAATQSSRAVFDRRHAEARDQIAELRRQLTAAREEAADLRETTSNLSAELSRLRASDREKADRLAALDAEHAERMAEAERRRLAELAELERRHADAIAAAEQRFGMAQTAFGEERRAHEQALVAMEARVAGAEQARDAAVAANESLEEKAARAERQVAELKESVDVMRAGHEAALERLQARTDNEISVAEALIAETGLDLGDLLDAAGDPGSDQGGPFVPVAGELTGDQTVLAAIRRLEDRIQYKDKLLSLQLSLPLRPPVTQVSVSSQFGKRKDPKTGRSAFHEGMDFRGSVGTPVYAAGSGTVTYAGWYGDYGRLIEIDHGLGVRTRYAHLKKVEVRKGDVVEANQAIGQLGNSGRSTGPHLHYEVLFQKDPVDPANFMKVGQNVCKG